MSAHATIEPNQIEPGGGSAFSQLNPTGIYSWGNGDTAPANFFINLATVRTNAAGFTNGAIFYAGDSPGTIGWISPDGSAYSNVWVTLTNESDRVRGLYVDQTGIFSNNLIAVTGDGGVWEITSARVATKLATITNAPLQGVITLTNDSSRWGPWAGKIVAGSGDTNNPVIYSISSSGVVSSNMDLGIVAADFNVIVTNQNLYFNNGYTLLKAASNLFTNDVGGLLILQPRANGCQGGGCPQASGFDHEMFLVHWNGTKFVASRSIAYPGYDILASDFNNDPYWVFWQATFAPLDIEPFY
jgi:hypothetical protein